MQNMKQSTIDFYNTNAFSYFDRTVGADMSEVYNRFIKYMKPEGVIIDIGAGSGRDIKYFMKAGFEVYGIEVSKELAILATKYCGVEVICQDILKWNPTQRYEGVWANASLMHLSMDEVEKVIVRMLTFLSDSGVMYISFKEDVGEEVDEEGRYFNGMTVDMVRTYLKKTTECSIVENWISEDAMLRNDVKWRNLIIQRSNVELVDIAD